MGEKKTVAEQCPVCDTAMVRIVYGYPADETFEAAERGEVVLGGCLMWQGRPQTQCPGCRYTADQEHNPAPSWGARHVLGATTALPARPAELIHGLGDEVVEQSDPLQRRDLAQPALDGQQHLSRGYDGLASSDSPSERPDVAYEVDPYELDASELGGISAHSPPATSAASSSTRTSSTGASARMAFSAGSRSPVCSYETYGYDSPDCSARSRRGTPSSPR